MTPHVLAVRQDNNGDVALIGPAIRALATRARVSLVCAPSGEGAAELLPGVDRIIVARAEWIDGRPRPLDPDEIGAYVARIRAAAIDEAFVFTSFHQSPLPAALLLRLAGVPKIHAICEDYPGSLLDTRLRVEGDCHESQRALELVGALGYALAQGDDGRLRFRDLPKRLVAGRYVAVQPGASVQARAWAPRRHRELLALLAEMNIATVIVGSGAEAALANFVAGDSGARDLAGRTSFAEFAAVVRDADALVVGNTSGIHVASAVATPVVAIFPPTIPAVRFAPWKVPHVLLGRQGIPCAGCRARVCPIPGQPCIGEVRASDVLDALRGLGALERWTAA